MKHLLWLLLALCGALSLPAAAYPTFGASSGYICLPGARVDNLGQFDVAAAYVHTAGTNELSALTNLPVPCKSNGYNLRGVAGLPGGMEVGIGYLSAHKSYGDARALTLAAKKTLFGGGITGFTVSAGASYRDWSSDMVAPITGGTLAVELPTVYGAYVVADKTFGIPASDLSGTVSAGLGWTHFNGAHQQSSGGAVVVPAGFPITADGTVSAESFTRLFLGADVNVGELTFIGEYQPAMKSGNFKYQDTLWSLAAQKRLGMGLTATAGLTTFNVPYTEADTGYFIDLSYGFLK